MKLFIDDKQQTRAIEPGQEFLIGPEWVELTPEQVDGVLNPPETPEQAAARLLRAVESHMDTTAQEKGYDTRYTCALRAGYVNPWRAEGQAFGEWMDSCYSYLYAVQADVKKGTRSLPTEAELIAELPDMVWPS